MTGPLVLSAAPTTDLQASTKKYVDDKVAVLGTGDFKKDGSVVATGNFDMGGFKVRNAGNPGLDSDLTTKSYVDGADANLQGQITNLGTDKIS